MSTGPAGPTCGGCRPGRPGSSPAWAGPRTRSPRVSSGVARWSGRTSAAGVYLDGIGHYLGETALLAGLGIRAQGHLALAGGYVTAGLAAAVFAALVKAETDNVIVARAKSGLPGGY